MDEVYNNYKGDILVVDDTPANLRLLVGILTEHGYKVRPIPNGKLALSGIQLSPPDLILLDIMMPEMNGYEVCEHLKAHPGTKDIPVIFISAIHEVLDKVKAFAVGGVDYITKPFQMEEVLARVDTHLSIRRLQKSLEAKNNDLAHTLDHLKATQNQLIHSEKMAALGNLIANIAHEVNTPLGAIRSSIENIADFMNDTLEKLPKFFQEISLENQQAFLEINQISKNKKLTFSAKEKRQFRRQMMQKLEKYEILNAESIADTLIEIGIYEKPEKFLSLLQNEAGLVVLNMAYEFSTLQTSTRTIITATDRAAKVMFALKRYSREDQSSTPVKANIIDGIETALTIYHNLLKHGIEVVKNYQDSPVIDCYPDELDQVWTNLIHNAIQAMNNQGVLTIDVFTDQETVCVNITDNGPGVPEGIQDKIFEPFFTTKPPGEGSGLGLDIVRKIIDKHHGNIELICQGSQTTFAISLPISLNAVPEK